MLVSDGTPLTSNGDVRLPWPLRHGTDRSDSSSAGTNIRNVGNLAGVKGEQHCTAFYYVQCGCGSIDSQTGDIGLNPAQHIL